MAITITIILILVIVFYFAKQKPHDDDQTKANRMAAEIAKEFGNTWIDCRDFDSDSTDKYHIYVVFKEDGFNDFSKPYRIIETSYKSDSEHEKHRKAEYARMVLRALPYQNNGFAGSVYSWEYFQERRNKYNRY